MNASNMPFQLLFCGQETETTVAYGLYWNPSGPGGVKANKFSTVHGRLKTALTFCVEYQTVDTVKMRVLGRLLPLNEDETESWTSTLMFPLCQLLGWKKRLRLRYWKDTLQVVCWVIIFFGFVLFNLRILKF